MMNHLQFVSWSTATGTSTTSSWSHTSTTIDPFQTTSRNNSGNRSLLMASRLSQHQQSQRQNFPSSRTTQTSFANTQAHSISYKTTQSMAPPSIETNMASDPPNHPRTAAASPTADRSMDKGSSSPEKPIRNLTQAFEALCTEDHDPASLMSPTAEVKKSTLISPTGVADLGSVAMPPASPSPIPDDSLPIFQLHTDLQRELTDHQVQRVSYYSLLHDINKEAAAMFAQDPLYQNQQGEGSATPTPSVAGDESPLIKAVFGGRLEQSSQFGEDDTQNKPLPTIAIIDEEQWLLSAISKRSSDETSAASIAQCPATFLQAMGEKEYENPVHAVTGYARTQLWKPSRSWWEAKSGKNPWIEPSSHNKRWR